jgi:hypothetical protein
MYILTKLSRILHEKLIVIELFRIFNTFFKLEVLLSCSQESSIWLILSHTHFYITAPKCLVFSIYLFFYSYSWRVKNAASARTNVKLQVD